MPKLGEKVVGRRWAGIKDDLVRRAKSISYDESEPGVYRIFLSDGTTTYETTIWRGAVPWSVAQDYSQAQNDADLADFEANYKPSANVPEDVEAFNDPRLIRRFGNVTTLATTEVLVSARAYVPPPSAAQRSVKSSSANDAAAGSGAQVVRIVYLDNNYVAKFEDVVLNGTAAVNTVATDIRYVEDFFVVRGSVAAGAVELFTNTGGTGAAIVGIGSLTTQAFLCHHYVPAGRRCFLKGWGAETSAAANFKLTGQARFGAGGVNLVDQTLDLVNVTAARAFFDKTPQGVVLGERTYVRVTTVPGQATSTVIRAYMYLWEDVV